MGEKWKRNIDPPLHGSPPHRAQALQAAHSGQLRRWHSLYSSSPPLGASVAAFPPVRRCARTRPPRLVLQLSASPRDRPLVVRIAGDRRADRDRGLLAVARAASELFSCSVRPGQPPKPGLSCEEAESGIYEVGLPG